MTTTDPSALYDEAWELKKNIEALLRSVRHQATAAKKLEIENQVQVLRKRRRAILTDYYALTDN